MFVSGLLFGGFGCVWFCCGCRYLVGLVVRVVIVGFVVCVGCGFLLGWWLVW